MNTLQSVLFGGTMILSLSALTMPVYSAKPESYDPSKFRFKIDSSSPFKNRRSKEIEKINSLLDQQILTNTAENQETKIRKRFENPEVAFKFPDADIMGDLEAPNGEMWFYTGKFEYHEIPPHDNVWFTQRLLQEYTFTIYDTEMKVVGIIKDKIHYREGEKRAPLCELTPVVTRNFFNTDDELEVMVAVGINPADRYGVYYRSYVYSLSGEKDENGFDRPLMVFNSLLGDVIEGPESADGSDNYYFTFQGGGKAEEETRGSFWENLIAMKEGFNVYGKAIDETGPRLIKRLSVPIIQLPGDQESTPPLISMVHEGNVYFLIQQYKEPFYNRYDDPINADLTQREGNSLVIDIYKANEEGLELVSNTEIPAVLDPMYDSEGKPTVLFSYFGVGNLRYTGDVLFDAPGTAKDRPDFIITRTNYRPSSDSGVNSYFTYKNDGSVKNTLSLYSQGTRSMGNIKGFEPQQMFVFSDNYGYIYRFVDLYSAKTATQIYANYYYDEDSEPELLSANCDRKAEGDSYNYVFELRYPLIDDDENDILRFMHINADGSYNHTDEVNMGKGVVYAQSYLTTQALKPHAYSVSDTPAYMLLIKRGVDYSNKKIEELMVAEIISEENPEGKPLLICGPENYGVLSSIVPEFASENRPGHLFVYYYDSEKSKLSLNLYDLPLNADQTGIKDFTNPSDLPFSLEGNILKGEGMISVYSVAGSLIAHEQNAIDLSSLSKGIYIISCKGVIAKIIR